MKDARHWQPLPFELRHQSPRDRRPLTALFERAQPDLADVVPEGTQGRGIRRHGMVGEVARHDVLEPRALFRNGSVEVPPQLLLDCSELGAHAIPTCLPSELEVATSGFAADMREAQEREGLRLAFAAPFAIGHRTAAELDEACLFRM